MVITNLRCAHKPSYEMNVNAELVADAQFEVDSYLYIVVQWATFSPAG